MYCHDYAENHTIQHTVLLQGSIFSHPVWRVMAIMWLCMRLCMQSSVLGSQSLPEQCAVWQQGSQLPKLLPACAC